MSEPVWVRRDAVLAMHRESLAMYGGPEGVRDLGLLESALARPLNLLAYGDSTPSLAQLAAAYATGIVANHPFVDGNKRTALIVSFTFLGLNGLRLTALKKDRIMTFGPSRRATSVRRSLQNGFRVTLERGKPSVQCSAPIRHYLGHTLLLKLLKSALCPPMNGAGRTHGFAGGIGTIIGTVD